MRLYYITVLLSSVLSVSAIAQDRQFAYTYQSNTLSKGAMDLEAWNTVRFGREYFFQRLDTRLEMEVGLTNKLQSAVYINASHSAFEMHLDTLGGIKDPNGWMITRESNFSISNEWKWNAVSSATHKFGFALYFEFGILSWELEFENKLIFDRRTEKNLWAMNLVNDYEVRYEWKNKKAQRVHENEPEIDFAWMHLCKPNFGLGLEMVNSNEIEGSSWNFSALFAGPAIYYAGDKNFLVFNFLPQLMNLHKTTDAPNDLVLNAREKYQFRLIWGFSL